MTQTYVTKNQIDHITTVTTKQGHSRQSRRLVVQEETILGVSVVGTTPTFYRIPITTVLANHVSQGAFPQAQTMVLAHAPLDHLPGPHEPGDKSMKPLINRHAFLRCYEAFRLLVNPLPVVNPPAQAV
ncbi:hypothetical protein EDB92DRAFT_87516 [Lactarius akahatsu]|uniref:Uncharacterized protein n=1 Tax=Lactarius akahatsu TaxID=416441 RepID=A0AAD4LVL1_9AGAM|nr:hypothetical protein EDB92DRAFT_87516 [Lactarius akahatsu]